MPTILRTAHILVDPELQIDFVAGNPDAYAAPEPADPEPDAYEPGDPQPEDEPLAAEDPAPPARGAPQNRGGPPRNGGPPQSCGPQPCGPPSYGRNGGSPRSRDAPQSHGRQNGGPPQSCGPPSCGPPAGGAPAEAACEQEVAPGEETALVWTDYYIKLKVAFRKSALSMLKGAPLSVFLCLALHMNQDGIAYPGIEAIMRETGYSRASICAALDQLESLGLISKLTGRYRADAYRVHGYAWLGVKPVPALFEPRGTDSRKRAGSGR
jgi:hypothetical protein